jgi:hypothetical protein
MYKGQKVSLFLYELSYFLELSLFFYSYLFIQLFFKRFNKLYELLALHIGLLLVERTPNLEEICDFEPRQIIQEEESAKKKCRLNTLKWCSDDN